MEPQYFLRGCWKTGLIENNISAEVIKEDLDVIVKLLKIETDPETTLLLIFMTIYKGICAETIKNYLESQEAEPFEGLKFSCIDKVRFIRALGEVGLAPRTKLLMIMAILSPGSLKEQLDENDARTSQVMTPTTDNMTPLQEPSYYQHAVTIS